MKPTFLNQNRPLITGMILKDNPDSIRFAVKNSIYDGADCLGIQLERLKKEFEERKAKRFRWNDIKDNFNEYYKNKIDWQALAIDWECSRFTKNAAPLTARQEMYNQINKHPEYEDLLISKLLPVLDELSI